VLLAIVRAHAGDTWETSSTAASATGVPAAPP
jgi:hypothetical protein